MAKTNSEMIGRLVRVIAGVIAEKVPNDRSAVDATKAAPAMAYAVLAVLRKPTEAMLRAGYETDDGALGDNTMTAEKCWAAMIDQALSD